VYWASHGKRRSERVGDDIVCTAARSFVPLLFPPTRVMRLEFPWSWRSCRAEPVLCVSCANERRVSGSRGGLEIESSVFSWRMERLDRRHLSALGSPTSLPLSHTGAAIQADMTANISFPPYPPLHRPYVRAVDYSSRETIGGFRVCTSYYLCQMSTNETGAKPALESRSYALPSPESPLPSPLNPACPPSHYKSPSPVLLTSIRYDDTTTYSSR